ncbi:formate dehydrogenase accessory sulfurtransferase FdhD [Pusillimonas sp. CC-YST705]|uniref:Sulfur carrier protein FdhD n=1 Tax=Mesopusillimonas faecipullorum TaxID=2755040 RepID=A0ABS8CBX9_9BURK|nr:formate dehydrogenase accessory sulfurtransferase FdhD [Mesopusillimonas faecipullorum]MCB5363508.1 formate dehydrogenase accessory sulfurtransferase FdhD [Mesopusillimonas faecipullorum]
MHAPAPVSCATQDADSNGVLEAQVHRYRDAQPLATPEADWLAQETPIALEYNGISHATVLATPCDIEDLALGFSITEGIVRSAADVYDIEVTPTPQGLIAQLSIASACLDQLKRRRRTLAGRTGCGLCGLESLDDVVRPLPPVAGPPYPILPSAIVRAMQALRERQPLHQQTGATHAAAWATLEGELLYVREDVGRHNALDKLIGALLRQQLNPAQGMAVISSRASFEMVQKAAAVGIPAVAAVSAPTSYAVQTAQQLGVLLIGFARNQGFTAYAHPQHLGTQDSESLP